MCVQQGAAQMAPAAAINLPFQICQEYMFCCRNVSYKDMMCMLIGWHTTACSSIFAQTSFGLLPMPRLCRQAICVMLVNFAWLIAIRF